MQKRPILIIDDDVELCELVTSVLTREGFEVLSAPDGQSGIETARMAQPAVIILDMILPGMNGIVTCQRLKRDAVLWDIPVIAITGSTELEYTAGPFRAGAEFFLPKPFNSTRLLGVVKLAAESAMSGTPMRRYVRHPRFPAEIPVTCLVSGKANTTREIVGQTGNVSLGGLFLLLPERLAPGAVIRLSLKFPEGTITGEGVVVWQNPQPTGDGSIQHGIQLRDFIEETGLVQYRRFLSQIAGSAAA